MHRERGHAETELIQEAAAEHAEARAHEAAAEPELIQEAELNQEAAAETELAQESAAKLDEERLEERRDRARPRGSRGAR